VRRAIIAILASAAACLLWPTAPALSWANGGDGGNGFGTHDWLLVEANRLAAKKNADWLRLGTALAASDDPDTVFHDTYHHVYDIWGSSTYGDAPDLVARYYRKALAARRQHEYRRASRMVGLMSHYYTDICNPLHTDGSKREDAVHTPYENAVLRRTDARGEHRAWIVFDGYRRVDNITLKARNAARRAHRSYATLVDHYYRHGYDATVARITRQAMNRGANGLADIVITLKRKAP